MRPIAPSLARPLAAALATIVAFSQPASAAPLKGTDAQAMLFSGEGVKVAINQGAGLSETDAKTLRILVESNGFNYYGAIAFSPDDGIMSESLQGAFNYHDVNNASRVAIAACNAAKKPASRPCIVGAQVFPSGYKPGRFQISQAATAEFGRYLQTEGARALAISASTGGFGFGAGASAEAAALQACRKEAKRNDCRVVVKD